MDQDVTWYAGRPRPRPHCVRYELSSPKTGHSSPTFRPMSIVVKRSPISATAELVGSAVCRFCTMVSTVVRRHRAVGKWWTVQDGVVPVLQPSAG